MMTKKTLGVTAVSNLLNEVQSLKSTSAGFTPKIEAHATTTTGLLKAGYADLDSLVDVVIDQAQVAGIANSQPIKDMVSAQAAVHHAFGNGSDTTRQPHRQTGTDRGRETRRA